MIAHNSSHQGHSPSVFRYLPLGQSVSCQSWPCHDIPNPKIAVQLGHELNNPAQDVHRRVLSTRAIFIAPSTTGWASRGPSYHCRRCGQTERDTGAAWRRCTGECLTGNRLPSRNSSMCVRPATRPCPCGSLPPRHRPDPIHMGAARVRSGMHDSVNRRTQ